MRARHLGQRGDIRSGADGIGRHFLGHHGHFSLTIIASVEPRKPWTQAKLDQLEGKFQKNLMTMDYNGGLNIRDDVKRRRIVGV